MLPKPLVPVVGPVRGRLLAVAEIVIPWEPSGLSSPEQDKKFKARHVKLVHEEMQLLANLIFYVQNITVALRLRCTCPHDTIVQTQLTALPPKLSKPVGSSSSPGQEKYEPEPTVEIVGELPRGGQEDPMDFGPFVLLSGAHYTMVVRIFAKEVPVAAMAAGLNHARLGRDPLCDALLCVGAAELPAHRSVLALQSEVFAKMFAGSFKEAQDGRVVLEETCRAAVELFLEYVYTEAVADWKGLELELLDLAERYSVDRLKEECRLRLWTVDAPRALRLLKSASPHVADLRPRFARILMNHWRVVTESDVWADLQAMNPLAADLLTAAFSSPALTPAPQKT